MGTTTTVQVEDRTLRLSNLDKVLWPGPGFTKGEMLDYYARIAPALLPHLADRPLSMKRYPDGVTTDGFFAKNAPRGTPDWVRTVRLPVPGSTKNRDEIDYVVVDGLPTLMWAANLAAIELHVPQWTVGPRGGVHDADLVVFDLDPGVPATVVECAQVAAWLREALAADGLAAFAKTSGSKGMQLYVPVEQVPATATSAYAKALAERLESEHPGLVTAKMAKAVRPGKIFIDWSQNNAAKTTVAPYSLRARDWVGVSTPLTWDEVGELRTPADGSFAPDEVLARVARDGDLLAGMDDQRAALPLAD